MMRTVTLELPDDVAERLETLAQQQCYMSVQDLMRDELMEVSFGQKPLAATEVESWLQTTVHERANAYRSSQSNAIPLKDAFDMILNRTRSTQKPDAA
jgi:predicted transcriptional regulator